ncbi:hypothetical protein CR513_11222, partial [Mucuna pruriens]
KSTNGLDPRDAGVNAKPQLGGNRVASSHSLPSHLKPNSTAKPLLHSTPCSSHAPSGLDALEGTKQSDFDAADLCLLPDIVVPPKFELPTFDKYGGTTCPKSHLTMYCWKMAQGFLNQYKYNIDMASDRSQLQNMAKGEWEAFKGYIQRWRELAARI